MKLQKDVIINVEKITEYLLKWRPLNDKSNFLEMAGYKLENWNQLEKDIREQILPLDAIMEEKTKYGDLYRISGNLTGPNGKSLKIITIWMIELSSNQTKFITLYPGREG